MDYIQVVKELDGAKNTLTSLDREYSRKILLPSGDFVAETELCSVEWPPCAEDNSDVVLSVHYRPDNDDPDEVVRAAKAEDMGGLDLIAYAYLRMRFEAWRQRLGEFPGDIEFQPNETFDELAERMVEIRGIMHPQDIDARGER